MLIAVFIVIFSRFDESTIKEITYLLTYISDIPYVCTVRWV